MLTFRWAVPVVWIVAVVGLMAVAPPMADLVARKGQITVPDGYSSATAREMLAELDVQKGADGVTQLALVFHDPAGLSDRDLQAVQAGLDDLRSRKDLGIERVIDPFDVPEMADRLKSADGTTVLASVSVAWNGREAAELREQLNEAVADIPVEHYFTGNWLIDEDVVLSSQEGLKRTEVITVAFILIILLIVFRSVVAPLIPLVTVGVSYLAAQSVVAILIDRADFPVSTFTQIFMVAVMFGIGTDYCILLLSRFKEELVRTGSKADAVLATYRSAGKTVLFAGLAVLVGFSTVGLSQFVLYRSAVAVAVGVAVLMVALVTLVPFFMAVLGKAIFWPVRGELRHKPSRVWEAAGKFSLTRPLVTLLVLAAVLVPLLVRYEGGLSYNMLDEIGDKYDSVNGFNLIADRFGPGEALPTTIVIRGEEALDNPAGMAAIEKISRAVLEVDGVASVRSLTRPTGEPIEAFDTSGRMAEIGSGLGRGRDGLKQIRDGLAEAGRSLTDAKPQLEEAIAGAGRLADGTRDVLDGVRRLGEAIAQVETGLREGEAGAGELLAGLEQAQASAQQLREAYAQLLASYDRLGGGLAELAGLYERLEEGAAGLAAGTEALRASLGNLAAKYPELAGDTDFLTAQGAAAQAADGAGQLAAGLAQLNDQLAQVSAGLTQANAGLSRAVQGQQALAAGFDRLVEGLGQLRDGLAQAAAGQGQIAGGVPDLAAGLEQVAAGQGALAAGFSEVGSQLAELTAGLAQSVDGLTQIEEGLGQAQTYLTMAADAEEGGLPGWFAPEEALANEAFRVALDTYLSPDRKLTTIDVVLAANPYAESSLALIDEIEKAVQGALDGTVLEGAQTATAGVTSIYHDLQQISEADYNRTIGWMLAGIFVILAVLLRSLVMPVYLVASLILTYYVSMSVAEWVFTGVFGYDGLSWAIPFFGYNMLVALGIDYSIFLMGRFRENADRDIREAILDTMRNMGTVIISAAVILGGTFAAMLPSGVLSLLQIATVLLAGLFLYALVVLPLFIPVMIRAFGRANWWPFMQADGDAERPVRRAGSSA
jgi:RND superfamily putative drug exporter